MHNKCGFTIERLSNSKDNASKVKKVVEIFQELAKEEKKESAADIDDSILKKVLAIIPEIPRKTGAIKGAYSFYESYKMRESFENKEARAITTIRADILSFRRFVDYLHEKKYINEEQCRDVATFRDNLLKRLNVDVRNERTPAGEKVKAFSDLMLKNIFDRNKKPYSIVFKGLEASNIKNKDALIMRFYVPLIMFFAGTRIAEATHVRTEDTDIFEYEGKEILAIYIHANETTGIKTSTSRRKIYVHDFLAEDLNLINFVKIAKEQNRKYLFNAKPGDEEMVSKRFNRDKEFLEGATTKDDEFFNAKYSLYSFRHLFKTHMLVNGESEMIINGIQGHSSGDKSSASTYVSDSQEHIGVMNRFKKHKVVKEQLEDFKKLSRKICAIIQN